MAGRGTTPLAADRAVDAGAHASAHAGGALGALADPSGDTPALPATQAGTLGIDIWLGANSHGEMGWFGSHSLNLPPAPEQTGAWGATITFGYAVIHMVFHGLPNQRMRLRHDAHRFLRRIWATRNRVVWPPKLVMHPHDLTPLAMVVGEQSSFERAVPARS